MMLAYSIISYKIKRRALKNAPFCPISASGSDFNPRNTQCIHPKGISCGHLWLKSSLSLILNKIERFSKVSRQRKNAFQTARKTMMVTILFNF